MKKIVLFITLLAGSYFFVSGQDKLVSDPNVEVRTVGSFSAIKVSDDIDLQLSQSDKEALAVSATNVEFRNRIKTTIENGVLRIWFDNEKKWWKNSGNKKLKAYVSFKTLERISASGASDVMVTGMIKGDNLDIHLNGASDFRGGVQVNSLKVDLSGASDAFISGSASSMKVDVSGASEMRGYDLTTDNCEAHASGTSEINITVNKELSAHASGASDIRYKGNGVIIEFKTSGSSSVKKS